MRITPIASLLIAIACAAFAGQNRWTESSPEITAVSPIYADPGDAATAYTRTPVGYYRTTDAGATWTPIAPDLLGDQITAFYVTRNSVVYAAAHQTIFVSRDRGDNWDHVADFGARIYALVSDGALLVCGTEAGIAYSTDSGGTWRAAAMPDGIVAVPRLTLTADALFAIGVHNVTPTITRNTTLRSLDRGRTWTALDELGSLIYGTAASSSVFTLYPELSVSTDHGNSWKPIPLVPSHEYSDLAVDGEDLYAATFRGGVWLYHSGSWTAIAPDITAHSIAAVSGHIYAAPQTGILALDAGTNARVNGKGLPGANAVNVAIADADPSVRYAATQSKWYRTADAGAHWSALDVPLDSGVIAVSADSANTAYMGGSRELRKTVDGGVTWKTVSPHFTSQIAMSPSNAATLYAVFASNLAKSTDAGESWNFLAPMPMGTFFYFYGYGYPDNTLSIAVDPNNDSNVVVAGYKNVSTTRNGGASWQIASDRSLSTVVMDRGKPATLYGIGSGGTLIRSEDLGSTWSSAGLADLKIDSIAAGGSRICAQSSDASVYCRENGGPWTGVVDGYARTPQNHLTIDASGTHLASATNAGIWSYDIVGDGVHPRQIDSDPSRLAHALDAQRVVVIPVGGTARGANALFTTELTISSPSAQRVIAVWLPAGGSGAKTFELDPASGSNEIFDVAERFGIDGIGSLALFAADSGAAIDASARIWTHSYGGAAPLREEVPGVSDLALHPTANVTGVAQDSETRTNIGIVNLSAETHGYLVQISGERKTSVLNLVVAGFSLLQVPVPNGDYGGLSIQVTGDPASHWLVYGSSIDRRTGEAYMSLGH